MRFEDVFFLYIYSTTFLTSRQQSGSNEPLCFILFRSIDQYPSYTNELGNRPTKHPTTIYIRSSSVFSRNGVGLVCVTEVYSGLWPGLKEFPPHIHQSKLD